MWFGKPFYSGTRTVAMAFNSGTRTVAMPFYSGTRTVVMAKRVLLLI